MIIYIAFLIKFYFLFTYTFSKLIIFYSMIKKKKVYFPKYFEWPPFDKPFYGLITI